MDPQKFYEFENGNVYNVHFPNKLGYSIDEIKEIFSEFGDVVSVTKAGDDYGFRFVKYITEEEVQRCVIGLKNHKTIRLLPKRLKQNNDQRDGQRNNNRTNKQEPWESKGNWASWEQKKPEDGEKSHQNNSRRTEGHREYTNRRSDNAAPMERGAQSHNKKPQQTSANVVSLSEDKIENGPVPRENYQERVNNYEEVASVDADNVKPINSPIQPQVPAEANKVCNPAAPPTASPAVPPTVPLFAATNTLRTPLLKTVTEEAASSLADIAAGNKLDPPITTPMPTTPLIVPGIINKDLPKLVQRSSKLEKPLEMKNPMNIAEIKPLTIEAEAIVVANVHTDYGVHYILHLFQKHNPICVTPMRIILKQGLRYCIVYVQSPLQASDIEEKFDNYSLCGKELIVLRAQKLAQFADEL